MCHGSSGAGLNILLELMSFPNPDDDIRNYFLQASSLSPPDVEIFFWCWFLELFDAVKTELRNIPKQDTYEDLAAEWRGLSDLYHSYFVTSVIAKAVRATVIRYSSSVN